MASQWAARLPVTTVPRGRRPKGVTLIYPFYENHAFWTQQFAGWFDYAEDLRRHTTAIVVDDGSPTPIGRIATRPFTARLFRIDVDIPWNWLAARNIGAHHAETPWLILTDMDHVVPEDTLRAAIYGEHDPHVVYAFSRREWTGQAVTPHSASFLMSRDLFWKIGGYDETLSGHYGTDGDFRRRAMKVAPFKVLTEELIRYEYVADSSTARYQRKLLSDSEAVSRLVAARGKDWKPKVLSFPYHEIGATEAACR